MTTQAMLATLIWYEDSLNAVIVNCTDKEIKLALSKAKKEISKGLSRALESE